MISNREGREWLFAYLYDKGLKYILWDPVAKKYLGVNRLPKYEDGKWDYRGVIKCKIGLILDLIPSCNESNYLDIGKYLGITDWSAVAIDTPVYAKLNINDTWDKYHFAKYENGKVYCWSLGTTSWSKKSAEAYIPVSEVRLAEGGKP